MKHTACLLVTAVLLLLTATAHAEPWRENYGVPGTPSAPSPNSPETPADTGDGERYQWLYEKLLPADVRAAQPVEVLRTFQVHLKDTYQKFPDPTDLRGENLAPPKSIQGKITYVEFFPKKYAYDVEPTADGLNLHVKIHLKNPTPADAREFAEKVQGAEDLWNAHRLPLDFAYKFKFEIVNSAAEAPFSVAIVNSTRGPYDTVWGRDWSANTIAHEIGHMMGLGDEYQPIGKAYGCYMPSLMCDAGGGAPMPHHYYFILRRLMNASQP